MSFQQKREYIWDYYKLPIIIAFVAIFFIGYLVNTIFINPPKSTYVQVTVYGRLMATGLLVGLEEELTEKIVPDELKEDFTVITDNFYTSADPQMNMAMRQKFFGMAMANELDIIITEPESFEELVADGSLLSLEEILTAEQLEKYSRLLVNGTNSDISSAYGIDLSGSTVLKACGLNLENPACTFAITSKRLDIALETLDYLLYGDSAFD